MPDLLALLDDSPAGGLQTVLNIRVPLWVFVRRTPALLPDLPPDALEPFQAAFRAQASEDVFAYENFFWGVIGGVVLETGAVDGLHFSTSYALEAMAGWYAVHIEPGPANFRGLAANRPGALNIHAAICDRPRRVHFLEDRAVGGVVEFMSPSYVAQWHAGVDLGALPEVLCLPLAPLLAMHGISRVDLWVLDVEGGELAVLQAVDWAALEVGVIVVEAGAHSAAANRGVLELLLSRGFLWLGRRGGDYWFCREVDDHGCELHEKPGLDAWRSRVGAPALVFEE